MRFFILSRHVDSSAKDFHYFLTKDFDHSRKKFVKSIWRLNPLELSFIWTIRMFCHSMSNLMILINKFIGSIFGFSLIISLVYNLIPQSDVSVRQLHSTCSEVVLS